MKRKLKKSGRVRLSEQLDRLANRFEYGHLTAATDPASLIGEVVERLDKLDEIRKALEVIERLRVAGWCIAVKCLPKEMAWRIDGARSEYDAPCADREVGRGKWLAEAHWMGAHPWRNSELAFADTLFDALRALVAAVEAADAARALKKAMDARCDGREACSRKH